MEWVPLVCRALTTAVCLNVCVCHDFSVTSVSRFVAVGLLVLFFPDLILWFHNFNSNTANF